MKRGIGLFAKVIVVALLCAGCGSTGSAPSSIAGTWLFLIVESQCEDVIPGILNENDGTAPQGITVQQVGSQVSAQFVDQGGNTCSLQGTYLPDQFVGELQVSDGERTIVGQVEGFARVFNGIRQVDGWLRVELDTEGQCEGAIIEFCAKLDDEPVADPLPPTLSLGEHADCTVEGNTITIGYSASDPDSNALTNFFADRDGDITTTGDRVTIAQNQPEGDRSVSWDTSGVVPGVYTLVAVTTDGIFTVEDTSPLPVTVTCQTPVTLDFATSVGTVDAVSVQDMAGFPDGSFVVSGSFTGTADFGGQILTAVSGEDVFVARYDADGTLAWARSAGGPDGTTDQQEDGRGVATLSDGSVVVVGRFDGTITFAGDSEGQVTLTQQGTGDDVFIARYSGSGDFLWVRQGAGDFTDEADGVAPTSDGGFVVSGHINSVFTLNFGESDAQTLPNPTGSTNFDGFLARYSSDGSLQWATRFGGDGAREFQVRVATFADDSSVVTGCFEFRQGESGQSVIGSATSPVADGQDAFFARFDAAGSPVWARFATGPGNEEGRGVTALIDGSCVVTGEFSSTMILGSGGSDQMALTSNGDDDVFVVRFGLDGTILWARSGGGPEEDEGHRIASFPDGSVVVAGEMEGEAVFGAGGPNETTLANRGEVGDEDILLLQYDVDGNLIWACNDGGSGAEDADAIVAFPDGSFVYAGDGDDTESVYGECEGFTDGVTPLVRYENAPVGEPLDPPPPDDDTPLTDEQVIAQCPDIDIVFLVDTSGSMLDDIFIMCGGDVADAGITFDPPLQTPIVITGALDQVEQRLTALGADVRSRILGITEDGADARARLTNELPQPPPSTAFDCIENGQTVVDLLTNDVPVDGSITGTILFDDPIDLNEASGQHSYESWGSAIAIVANADAIDSSFWRPNAIRIIVPVSDEGPEKGMSIPGVQEDSGQDGECDAADFQSVDNAIAFAQANDAIVAGIAAFLIQRDVPDNPTQIKFSGFHPCLTVDSTAGATVAQGEMDRLAAATGGVVTRSADLNTLVSDALSGPINPAELPSILQGLTEPLEDALFEIVVESCRTALEGIPD